jgi:hypothetical protein
MTNQTLEDQPSAEPSFDGKAVYLTTAGGQIKCLRCTARSSRTKLNFETPA